MSQNLLAQMKPATTMREAFDSAFSRAPVGISEPPETLLAIRVGHAPYAIRLTQTLGLHVDKPIIRLPGTPPEVLGISGFRGTIATIFDLRVLLGADSGEVTRWLVLVSTSPGLGIAFDEFEGHFQCSPEDIATTPDLQSGRSRLIGKAVGNSHGEARPILNLSELSELVGTPDAVRATELST